MIDEITKAMYEKAKEVQNYFEDGKNRKREDFTIRYYQYPCKFKYYEREGFISILGAYHNYHMSTMSMILWLPSVNELKDMIPHKDLIELDSKFNDFKRMFYESHWFTNDVDSLEGRGRDPLDCFKTYDELWLGFVMMDRYQKRWNGKEWVPTDIYPDYFDMDKETAKRDGYPDPDRLEYVAGLRGVTE